MATSSTLLLDNRRPKADGTFPLIIRIIHNRTIAQITLGTYLEEKDWNEEKKMIKTTFKGTESVTRLNNQIRTKTNDVADFIAKLDEKKILHSFTTANQIKERFEKKLEKVFVFAYMQQLIDEMEKANRIGNARTYKSVKGILETYCNDKDMTFNEMDYAFLMRFETDHYASGNKVNSLSVYMRTLRAVFNRAIKDELIEPEIYPFKKYQIKSTKPNKRAINMTAIKKIEDLIFDPNHPLAKTHDYFMFCFNMRGMPFTDMAHLKVENIVDGRIKFDRQKTDKAYNIKITPIAQKILDKYIIGKGKDEYIFPIIYRESPKDIYRDVEWARNRYNKKLKLIATLCGITENMTSYVGRHSFANQAKNLGIPVANISDMLGHDDIKTTQIYLDTLPSVQLDDYQEQVINSTQAKSIKKSKSKKL
jgi:site-specific recombinase XerD